MARKKVTRICGNCGVQFEREPEPVPFKRYFCTSDCYHAMNRGENHSDWRGGKWDNKGYPMERHSSGKRRAAHIGIAERVLGRPLRNGEVVHHINGNKSDNRNTNLLICTNSYHVSLHAAMSMKYAALLET